VEKKMAEVALQAQVRKTRGKKSAKQFRRNGIVPGIYYAQGQDSVVISVDDKALRRVLMSDAKIIDVSIDGGAQTKCVIREVQYDPVKGAPLHVDLMGVKLTQKVKVKVPVQAAGTAAGVKEGGVLQIVFRELEIEALPLDIPEHITVEVSALKINEAIHVSEIVAEKFKLLADPDAVVVAVLPPRLEEVTPAAPTEEAAEPEVIGRAKKEEEVEGEPAKEAKPEKKAEKEKK
jgi:large subunit ribosomal protein L25